MRLAKAQQLELEYEMGGTIFTTLTVRNLRAKPTEPGPIERLEIRSLKLRYSLTGLLRRGLPGLLKDVDLRDAFVIIAPAKFPADEIRRSKSRAQNSPSCFPKGSISRISISSPAHQRATRNWRAWLSILPRKKRAL